MSKVYSGKSRSLQSPSPCDIEMWVFPLRLTLKQNTSGSNLPRVLLTKLPKRPGPMKLMLHKAEGGKERQVRGILLRGKQGYQRALAAETPAGMALVTPAPEEATIDICSQHNEGGLCLKKEKESRLSPHHRMVLLRLFESV